MYSVVKIGGHQYMVRPGDLVDVQKLKVEENSTLDLEQVLFVGGEETQVGTPVVGGAKVTAKVLRHDRSRKKIVFKRSPGSWRKKRGHRQEYTALLVTEITDGKGNTETIAKDHKNAVKYLK